MPGKGIMTRSRRIELAAFADEDDEMSGEDHGVVTRKGNAKEREGREFDVGTEKKEPWSPWKDRYRNSMTPGTPGKRIGGASKDVRSVLTSPWLYDALTDPSQFALPSLSPFKVPHATSPLRQPTPSGGLSRTATTSHLRRASSVLTDVSMGHESPRLQQHSLYSGLNGTREEDESMSENGERGRDGSVLVSTALPSILIEKPLKTGVRLIEQQDWFMRDRWTREPGSSASVAASRRLGSAAPSMSALPIRKGQMVWAGEKGFVRESELKAGQSRDCFDSTRRIGR